jgi:hypothetical protein
VLGDAIDEQATTIGRDPGQPMVSRWSADGHLDDQPAAIRLAQR